MNHLTFANTENQIEVDDSDDDLENKDDVLIEEDYETNMPNYKLCE